jgi:hypothetical protein
MRNQAGQEVTDVIEPMDAEAETEETPTPAVEQEASSPEPEQPAEPEVVKFRVRERKQVPGGFGGLGSMVTLTRVIEVQDGQPHSGDIVDPGEALHDWRPDAGAFPGA